jgi:TP901 family phage tail tape measure protein
MAMNMEAMLKIAAKVTGLNDLGALEKGLIGAEKAAGAAKGGFKAMLDSSAWQGAAVAAAGIGVALGLSVKAAIDFEESMAEVRKVVSGLESPEALQEIQQEIFGLSREIPITAKGFAEMYAAAGQAGIPKAELRAFAVDVSKVAIAFDMTAAEAGNAMAKLRTNLGFTQPELMKLADAANYLSNNMASTATEIVEFMLRSGSAGKQAGLSAEQTAAFGSAMIASGAQAEVAATSFNNMIIALSRGPSMTERQISALVRLGYGQADAARREQELTQAVEEQSRQRLDAYRNETDAALKEINRRYRDQMQALEDGWGDQQSAYEDAASNRLETQIKALSRQRNAEIEASYQRAEASGTSNRNELNQISDFYDERIDALRDANSAEIKDRQRQARDQQQQVKDQLDDQKEMEINAVQQKYNQLKTIEDARKKLAIDDAKATAAAIVGELGTNMAAMLQQDAIGTIRDVFGRIKALPAEMQMSVISDLFGDEAKALLPLITNTQLMEQALSLVGDQSKYAGSTSDEFQKRLATTASQLQLAENNLKELSITFGAVFLVAISDVLNVFAPLVKEFTWLITNVPILGPSIALVTSAFVGLIAVAPTISGLITLLGQLGITGAKIGALFKGFGVIWLGLKTAFLIAFQPILAWIGSTFIPALLALFSGPVGWTVLAIAAVVAMAVLFRKPIGDFFNWLGRAISKAFSGLVKLLQSIFVQPWVNLWNNVLRGPVTAIFSFMLRLFRFWMQTFYAIAYQLFVQPWVNLWNNVLRGPVTAIFSWISSFIQVGMQKAYALAYLVFVQPWISLWNNVLRGPVTAAVGWLQGVWTGITTFFNTNVVIPIRTIWTTLTEFLPKTMSSLSKKVQNIWTGVVNTIKGAMRNVLQFIANAINSVGWQVNRLIIAFNRLPGPDIPFVPTLSVPKFAQGGVVNGPTLAMVGEGGEREYIIPASKMAAASANYLNGARGGAVIPSGNAQINVTTGPVLQQGGQQYVTIADLERAMRKTADGVYASLRTPAGRYAMGVR